MASRRTAWRRLARLGTAALVAAASLLVAAPRAVADVGPPSWWDGDCDANRWNAAATAAGWTGPGAQRLSASYLGVPVCGPRRSVDAAPTVRWSRPGWGHFQWECVELTMRFMNQVYGVTPYGANGNQVVTNYSTTYGGGLQKVANSTPGLAPLPGDIISFDNPSAGPTRAGHAAVVAGTSVDANGNGVIVMLSQNDTADGWRRLTVTNWTVASFGSQVPTGWLHDPAGRGGGGVSTVPSGDGPAAASTGDGSTDVFARGSDDALWTRHLSNGGTTGWASLGGIITAAPAVASAQPGTLDVVVRGRDNALWTRRLSGGVWSAWASLGGIVTTAPALVSSAEGTLDLFARGRDNALWTRHFSGGTWSDWSSLGGILTTAQGAASSSTGVIDLFVVGQDKALWSRHFEAGSWGTWFSLGGIVDTAPGAVSTAPGSVDVFARGGDNVVWTRRLADRAWSGWSSVGWIVASPVTAVSVEPGVASLYARGIDGALWTLTRPSTATPKPVSLGGIIR